MRVCVVGCGAVGSLFAANLAQLDDVEVWAYDLSPEHVEAINAGGLRLSGADEVVGRLRATADPAELPACDFGIVATKSMHTGAAVASDVHALEDGERLLRSRTVSATRRRSPARRARDPRHDLPRRDDRRAGPRPVGREGRHDDRPVRAEPGADGRGRAARRRVHAAGMPTHAVADARGPQWGKLIFNAATNPIGALTGLTHGRVCEDPALRRLVSGLVDEGKAVAAAQGIELDSDPEELIDHAARPDVAYDHKASMLQDVEARRESEIDFLNGGIVRFGNETGVPTPLNQAIVALIKGLEASWRQ